MTVVDQLVQIYYKWDRHIEKKLTPDQERERVTCLMLKGRLVWHEENGVVGGYVESWRISYELLGRVLCGIPIHIGEENIEHGPVCYLTNTTIRPDARWTSVYRDLRNQFFQQNHDAEYYLGEARRKRTGLWKVFKASEISKFGMAQLAEVHHGR